MKLIGLAGAMGSGKSTTIEQIASLQHTPVFNIKFAQALYDMQEYIYKRVSLAYKRPHTFVKDRKLLQFLGTEWGRETIDQNIWLDLWKREVEYAAENYKDCIIVTDDVRFDNEAELIKSMGGTIILLKSDKNLERINTGNGISGHKSEAGVDFKYVDFIIENNGSIDDLRSALLTMNNYKHLW